MFLICVCWHPERMCRALSTYGQRGQVWFVESLNNAAYFSSYRVPVLYFIMIYLVLIKGTLDDVRYALLVAPLASYLILPWVILPYLEWSYLKLSYLKLPYLDLILIFILTWKSNNLTMEEEGSLERGVPYFVPGAGCRKTDCCSHKRSLPHLENRCQRLFI